MSMNRRKFLQIMGAAGTGAVLSPLTACSQGPTAVSKAEPHVVIVGGGLGGSTAAKYLRMADEKVKITIIDPVKNYITCLRSNDVIAGHMTLDDITFTHDALRDKYNINVIHEKVIGFDPDKMTVKTDGGQTVAYDRIVVSPGVDFIWDAIEGHSPEAAETQMPHGWKAGPQTMTIKKQLESMRQGGTFAIISPPNPFRCPPGPYERASLIAEWMQKHNPTGKVMILDAKDRFTKDGPLKKGWERLYGYGTDKSMIEWVSLSNGGRVVEVDPKNKKIIAETGDLTADVVNLVPAQKAGKLAFEMGLANGTNWCPVNRRTFESELIPNVHVIGDASIADTMPKSGYAANSQAKVAVQAIADLLRGREVGEPALLNVCYSLAGDEYGVSIADIFKVKDGKIVKVQGSGVSPITDSPAQPLLESIYQRNWHRTFVNDCFA